jgi:hypothetical protein
LAFFFPLIALITLEQDSYQSFLYGKILPKLKKPKPKGIFCQNFTFIFWRKSPNFEKKQNGFLKKKSPHLD